MNSKPSDRVSQKKGQSSKRKEEAVEREDKREERAEGVQPLAGDKVLSKNSLMSVDKNGYSLLLDRLVAVHIKFFCLVFHHLCTCVFGGVGVLRGLSPFT